MFATQPPGLVESNLDNDFNLSDLSEEEQSNYALPNDIYDIYCPIAQQLCIYYLTINVILASEASSRSKGNNRAHIHRETAKTEIKANRKVKYNKIKKGKGDKRHPNTNCHNEKADAKNKDYIRRNIQVSYIKIHFNQNFPK